MVFENLIITKARVDNNHAFYLPSPSDKHTIIEVNIDPVGVITTRELDGRQLNKPTLTFLNATKMTLDALVIRANSP